VLDESRAAPVDGVQPEEYRAVLRRHASGVVVVTAAAPGGGVAGITATSLVSLSLEPPLVCFAVAFAASAYGVLSACPTFAVNFLDADQAGIAVRFATPGIDRFGPPTRWAHLPTGEPVLLDAPAYLRCAVVDRVVAGDHLLVIGQVLQTAIHRGHRPLVYHEGAYGSVHPGRRRWSVRRRRSG
jgi:flavin reductase (DIM6/NTAB) family NADH-FMN oxidoreductase RutF